MNIKQRRLVLAGKIRWGAWRYLPSCCALEHESGYSLGLAHCRGSAGVLDWIAQVAGKPSDVFSVEDVGHFVRAMNDLADGLQEHVCGGGRDKPHFDLSEHVSVERDHHYP